MAGVKISALTTSATFSDTDVLPLVSGGVTKKVTGAVVKAAIGVPPAGSVGATQLANGSVTTPKLAAGAVNAVALGALSVETAKINDAAVTTPKIADANVTLGKLENSVQATLSRASQARPGGTIPTTGSVKGIVVLNGGSGYSSGVTIAIAAPPSGTTATATATVASGIVTAITIVTEGSGYTDQNPVVTITAIGAGSGATAVAYAMVNPLLESDGCRSRTAAYSFFAITSNDHIVVAGTNYAEINATGPANTDSVTPVNLPLVDSSGNFYKPIRLYSSGDSVYALANDGSLWSAGYNGYGQLGRGFTGASATFTQTNSVFRKITFGAGGVIKKFAVNGTTGSGQATCLALAETSAGQILYGWGYNGNGALGNGGTANVNTPQVLTCTDGASTITDIMSVGRDTYAVSVVLFSSGRVKASGYNGQAQLSRGNTTQPGTPTFEFVNVSASTPLTNVVELAGADGGYATLYFRTSGGVIYSCGYNGVGELGNGTTVDTSTYMVQVSGGAMFRTDATRSVYATGAYDRGFVFAFKANGELVAWGTNIHGNLGLGDLTSRSTPNLVSGFTFSDVSKIKTIAFESSAYYYSLSAILKTDGSLFAAGYNGYGNLGIGTETTTENVFRQVPFPKTAVRDVFFVGRLSYYPYLAIATNSGSVFTTGLNYGGNGLRGSLATYVTTHVQGLI
jgi:alpha-tubulin suppressor-like RCC1 family protein